MSDIAVSLSRRESADANVHTQFLVAHGPFANIPNFLCQRPWSPLVWQGGLRKSSGFQSANLIALDFDSGEWALDDAKDFVKSVGIAAVLGTSKSHQIQKGPSKPCDRFRLILQADLCTNPDDYIFTMRHYVDSLPCDKACKDLARFFFPCKEVVWTSFDGGSAKWLACPYDETQEAKDLAYSAPIAPEEIRNPAAIPSYTWAGIIYGATPGERHKTAYTVACELSRRGFSISEILALMTKHKSPLLLIGEGKDDVRRCIENGARRVGEQRTGRSVGSSRKVIQIEERRERVEGESQSNS